MKKRRSWKVREGRTIVKREMGGEILLLDNL
jgi:hypothetical protein